MFCFVGCSEEEAAEMVDQFERDKERMKLTLKEETNQLQKTYQVHFRRIIRFELKKILLLNCWNQFQIPRKKSFFIYLAL